MAYSIEVGTGAADGHADATSVLLGEFLTLEEAQIVAEALPLPQRGQERWSRGAPFVSIVAVDDGPIGVVWTRVIG